MDLVESKFLEKQAFDWYNKGKFSQLNNRFIQTRI